MWRFIKVLYFIITLPIVLVWWNIIFTEQNIYRWNNYFSVNDYYLWTLYLVLFVLSYIIITDFLRRIISYINKWKFIWFIPYLDILKKYIFLILIIWFWLISFLINWSENLRNECKWNNEIFNDYWVCICNDWFIRDKNKCIKDEKMYDDWELSFIYPWKLVVSNKEFEDFKFFENVNIHVKKYNFNSLMWSCIEWWSEIRSDWNSNEKNKLFKDLTLENKSILKNIKEWNSFNNNLDHFSCYATKWSIKSTPIKLNWLNWVILNYYFTQDPWMWCLTQFNTELLLVKDLDNIYSIMFRNNFWDVFNYLNQYKWEYWEVCLYPNVWINQENAEDASNKVSDFYEKWNSLIWTEYESFEKNDKIIKEIINTVKIK
jgi:hypothetical protein